MAKRRITENENIDTSIDISSWRTVLIDVLTPKNKDIYEKRKTAVEMYMDLINHSEIERVTGIHRNKLVKFVRQCLEFDEEGVIWGFRALIPHKRFNQYKSKSLPMSNPRNPNPNKNGAFNLLLDTFPELKKLIEKLYFKQSNRSASDPVMKVNYIHKEFVEKCREIGLKSPYDYPFNTTELARRSLHYYIEKLQNNHMVKSAERYGENSALLANSTGHGININQTPSRPFEQVHFDGHRLDTSIALVSYTPEGDEIITVIERIWLLVIIDVGAKAVLGYYVSYNKEFTSSDVLMCIRNAVVPWQPKAFSIPNLKYSETGGFPSGVIPETKWALWNEFLFDNGKANLSDIVNDRLKQVVKCKVHSGRIKSPIKRSQIERFFGILEENSFHRFPTTTGNSSKDPRRRDPEKQAIKFRVSAEEIEQVIEVIISDYNGTPHEGNNFFSPLEVMKMRLVGKHVVNVMPEERRNEISFLSLQATREVQGSIKKGRRPYIQYENVRYTNELLARSPGLIGEKIELLVNIDDLRVVKAFLPDGSELGMLKAMGKWGITPHSLRVRKEIFHLKINKLIHFTSSDNPVKVYQQYLEKGLKLRKSNGNKLIELKRNEERNTLQNQEENIESDMFDDIEIIPNVALPKEFTNVIPIISTNSPAPVIRKLRKTIIY